MPGWGYQLDLGPIAEIKATGMPEISPITLHERQMRRMCCYSAGAGEKDQFPVKSVRVQWRALLNTHSSFSFVFYNRNKPLQNNVTRPLCDARSGSS
jgi:hypothetical protein